MLIAVTFTSCIEYPYMYRGVYRGGYRSGNLFRGGGYYGGGSFRGNYGGYRRH